VARRNRKFGYQNLGAPVLRPIVPVFDWSEKLRLTLLGHGGRCHCEEKRSQKHEFNTEEDNNFHRKAPDASKLSMYLVANKVKRAKYKTKFDAPAFARDPGWAAS
jgi:hypothetical protein